MYEQITILIPTYNRKKELLNVLKQLEKQAEKHFQIVICNNASNYSVESLLDLFSIEFSTRIKIINRKYNVGADINICESFLYCNTKWAWTLSDDELVKENAVETIYKWIDEIPDFGCLNFSLSDKFNYKDDIVRMSTIDEFIEVYKQEKELHGDLIFLSNKVYNMEKLSGCIEECLKYVYTRVSTVIIYERMLEKGIPYICVHERIVDYNVSTPRSWRIYEVILATRTLADIKYYVSQEKRKMLLYIFSFDIQYVYFLWFVEGTELKNEKDFFDQIYHGIYKYFLPTRKRLLLKVISCISKSEWGYNICKDFFMFRFGNSLLALSIKRIVRILKSLWK